MSNSVTDWIFTPLTESLKAGYAIIDWLSELTTDQKFYLAIFLMLYCIFRQIRHLNRKAGPNQLNRYNRALLSVPVVSRGYTYMSLRRRNVPQQLIANGDDYMMRGSFLPMTGNYMNVSPYQWAQMSSQERQQYLQRMPASHVRWLDDQVDLFMSHDHRAGDQPQGD